MFFITLSGKPAGLRPLVLETQECGKRIVAVLRLNSKSFQKTRLKRFAAAVLGDSVFLCGGRDRFCRGISRYGRRV